MDVGPETGYDLVNYTTDLKPRSLSCVRQRLGRSDVQTVQAEVTQPTPLTFLVRSSVRLFYLPT